MLIWVLIRKPELFFQMKDVDFAVRGRGPTRNVPTVLEHCLKSRKKKRNVTLYNILRNRAQFEKCHNCVMYFRRGPGTRQLVDDWISVIEENLGGNDQKALHRLLLRKHYYAKELKLLCLPPTYADKSAIPGADTVIQQYQVSTELRGHGSIQTELRPE